MLMDFSMLHFLPHSNSSLICGYVLCYGYHDFV